MQYSTRILIGLLAGVLHYHHVKTLYENDRHISHLSNLEREMCFRSEMGLYYSFFKRIVSSQTLKSGILELSNDHITEYPNTINSLSKFNIYPEVLIAGIFKLYQQSLRALGLNGKDCYMINRGPGWPPVESCVGLEVPILFYLEVVWVFAGLTVFLLFCYGTYLSATIIGGFITVLSFFFNHTESTRVQWTPPLRESFAYPLIVLHCFMITSVLKSDRENSQGLRVLLMGIVISFSAFTSLLFWQFSQFILACEVAILIAMYASGIIEKRVLSRILTWISIGHVSALLGLAGNRLLLFSFLSAIIVSAWIMVICDQNCNKLSLAWGSGLRIIGIGTSAIIIKYIFPSTGNDSHIIKIFLSKVIGGSKDFHTLMYTCAPEFQGVSLSYGVALTKTLLIPLLVAVILLMSLPQAYRAYTFSRQCNIQKSLDFKDLPRSDLKHVLTDPPIVYNVCLLIAFLILSLMAMRLKLFLTPQMCVLVSLIASKQVMNSIPIVKEKQSMKYLFLVVILGAMFLFGFNNIRKQRSIEGEYSNYPLEELLTWVQKSTDNSAAFAGPMPITASILLSTGRPIVNHPYYEDETMRNRTIQAYSVFSRKSSSEAFESVSGLRVNYVILEANKCFDHRQPRKGCKMIDLWDIQDPKNVMRPPLCPQLFSGDASPFSRVFQNSEYVVLSVTPRENE